MRQALVVPGGKVILAGYDTAATPLAPTSKTGKLRLPDRSAELAALQERLFAEASVGMTRRVLLLLQGMDTSGKGGVTNHVAGVVKPIGVQYTAFKKPTDEERAHDFLWRIRRHLPEPGVIGVFDRSHYEDVLVPRAHGELDDDELHRRYGLINEFEAEITGMGTTIVKCFLHISYETQRQRLLARLDDPQKRWKFNEGDIAERSLWSEYTLAYESLLEHCNTAIAPWFIVPSDSKRYRNWAVGELLLETLRHLDPQYPEPPLDLSSLRAQLAVQRTNSATG
jgi:PPK2 family polyphosphate:nucleotide phosphotransferase